MSVFNEAFRQLDKEASPRWSILTLCSHNNLMVPSFNTIHCCRVLPYFERLRLTLERWNTVIHNSTLKWMHVLSCTLLQQIMQLHEELCNPTALIFWLYTGVAKTTGDLDAATKYWCMFESRALPYLTRPRLIMKRWNFAIQKLHLEMSACSKLYLLQQDTQLHTKLCNPTGTIIWLSIAIAKANYLHASSDNF